MSFKGLQWWSMFCERTFNEQQRCPTCFTSRKMKVRAMTNVFSLNSNSKFILVCQVFRYVDVVGFAPSYDILVWACWDDSVWGIAFVAEIKQGEKSNGQGKKRRGGVLRPGRKSTMQGEERKGTVRNPKTQTTHTQFLYSVVNVTFNDIPIC